MSGRCTRFARIALGLLILGATSLSAQTKPVRLAEFAWLEGQWTGAFGGGLAEETCGKPRAGSLACMFRLSTEDKLMVYEFAALVQTTEGVELRLRHFGAGLDAWEKDDPIVMKLISWDGKVAVFENFVHASPKRTTFTRQPGGYDVRSEILTEGQPPRIHQLSLRRP